MLKKGTKVINQADGEMGIVTDVCTFKRNGVAVYSYAVQTAYGKEIWHNAEVLAV